MQRRLRAINQPRGVQMPDQKTLNPAAFPDVVKACEDALTYINELLIDNEIDKSAKKISDKLYRALKKAGRV